MQGKVLKDFYIALEDAESGRALDGEILGRRGRPTISFVTPDDCDLPLFADRSIGDDRDAQRLRFRVRFLGELQERAV